MSTLSDIVRVWPGAEAPCRVCGARHPVQADDDVALVVPHESRPGVQCWGGRLTPAEVRRG